MLIVDQGEHGSCEHAYEDKWGGDERARYGVAQSVVWHIACEAHHHLLHHAKSEAQSSVTRSQRCGYDAEWRCRVVAEEEQCGTRNGEQQG